MLGRCLVWFDVALFGWTLVDLKAVVVVIEAVVVEAVAVEVVVVAAVFVLV